MFVSRKEILEIIIQFFLFFLLQYIDCNVKSRIILEILHMKTKKFIWIHLNLFLNYCKFYLDINLSNQYFVRDFQKDFQKNLNNTKKMQKLRSTIKFFKLYLNILRYKNVIIFLIKIIRNSLQLKNKIK